MHNKSKYLSEALSYLVIYGPRLISSSEPIMTRLKIDWKWWHQIEVEMNRDQMVDVDYYCRSIPLPHVTRNKIRLMMAVLRSCGGQSAKLAAIRISLVWGREISDNRLSSPCDEQGSTASGKVRHRNGFNPLHLLTTPAISN